jgi:hypothetical protein
MLIQEALQNNPNAHLIVLVNLTNVSHTQSGGEPGMMPELHTYADGDFFVAPSAAIEVRLLCGLIHW